MQGDIPPIAWVIAATVVVVMLARYFSKIGGLVLIALVFGLLLVASQRGVLLR